MPAAAFETRGNPGASRCVEQVARIALSLLLFCGTGIAALNYPLGPAWIVLGLGLYAAVLWRYPQVGLPAILAVLPLLNVAPWSGWILLNEFDLLVAVTLAVRLLRPRADIASPVLSRGAKWASAWSPHRSSQRLDRFVLYRRSMPTPSLLTTAASTAEGAQRICLGVGIAAVADRRDSAAATTRTAVGCGNVARSLQRDRRDRLAACGIYRLGFAGAYRSRARSRIAYRGRGRACLHGNCDTVRSGVGCDAATAGRDALERRCSCSRATPWSDIRSGGYLG